MLFLQKNTGRLPEGTPAYISILYFAVRLIKGKQVLQPGLGQAHPSGAFRLNTAAVRGLGKSRSQCQAMASPGIHVELSGDACPPQSLHKQQGIREFDS